MVSDILESALLDAPTLLVLAGHSGQLLAATSSPR